MYVAVVIAILIIGRRRLEHDVLCLQTFVHIVPEFRRRFFVLDGTESRQLCGTHKLIVHAGAVPAGTGRQRAGGQRVLDGRITFDRRRFADRR